MIIIRIMKTSTLPRLVARRLHDRLRVMPAEVQREPDRLRAVKRAIDRRRQPGQFLLTGSANLLLMRRVSESLAGRASSLTLWPTSDGSVP
jgi:AAA domain